MKTEINNIKWKLISFNNSENKFIKDLNVSLFLYHDKNNFGGNGPCNQFGGRYIINRSKIKFENIFSTQIACVNLAVEKQFFNCLELADNYQINQNHLILYNDKEILLKLESTK